jgi:hypothetical protein
MPGFGGLAGPAAALWATYVGSGDGMTYRRAFVTAPAPRAWIGGPSDVSQPIGIRDVAFDPTEGAVLDSTVDAGTGYTGGFAPPIGVHALVKRGDAQTAWQQYGLQLNEDDYYALLIAAEIAPAFHDLLIAPDDTRYLVGTQIKPVMVVGQTIGYAAQLERRDPTDSVYTV